VKVAIYSVSRNLGKAQSGIRLGVRIWHETDVPTEHGDVCYPGMNGLGLDAAGGAFIAPKTSMAGASRVAGYLLRKGLCPDGQGTWSA